MRVFSKIIAVSLSSLLMTTAFASTDDPTAPKPGGKRSLYVAPGSTPGATDYMAAFPILPTTSEWLAPATKPTGKQGRNNARAALGDQTQLEKLQAQVAALDSRVKTTTAATEPTPLEALAFRDLALEKAAVLGFSQMLVESTPDAIKQLAQNILKGSLSGKTWASDGSAREKAASFNKLTTPIRVIPCLSGSVELDEFNNAVTTGALLTTTADQQPNDFVFMKFGLARILAARTQELTTAEKYKGATIATPEKSCAELELTEAKEKVAREEERLQLAVFHLSVVRDYIQTSSAAASALEKKELISAGDRTEITRLRGSSVYLHEALHAIYDFDRSRLMGMLARLTEHRAAQSRYQTAIGQIPDHKEFVLDQAYLTASPDFTTALDKLLYKKEAPQLEEALKERIQFGEKVVLVPVVDSTAQAGYLSWLWGTTSVTPSQAELETLRAQVKALETAGSGGDGKPPVDTTAVPQAGIAVKTDAQPGSHDRTLPSAPTIAKVTHLGPDTADGATVAAEQKGLLDRFVDALTS